MYRWGNVKQREKIFRGSNLVLARSGWAATANSCVGSIWSLYHLALFINHKLNALRLLRRFLDDDHAGGNISKSTALGNTDGGLICCYRDRFESLIYSTIELDLFCIFLESLAKWSSGRDEKFTSATSLSCKFNAGIKIVVVDLLPAEVTSSRQ